MLYERHGDYEILEWDNNGECGVWMYPGAMDEVDPVIVLPTVEAARIWVQKKLAPAQPASANRDTGWSQQDVDELGFSAMALQPAPAVTSDAVDVHVVTRGRIADYVATGDFERVWAVIEGLQKQVRDGEFYQDIQAERGNDFEAECERLQAELASVKAALADMRKLVLSLAAPLHQDIVYFEKDADEDEDFLQWFAGRAASDLFYETTYAAYEIYERLSKEQASAAADVTTWALPSEMVTPEVKAVLERLQASVAPSEATATEIKQSDIIDHVSSELVMLQMAVAEALGLHRHALLDVDRDDIAEMIASLRGALEPFAKIYERWTNRLLVDQYFPEWLEIHLTVREQEGWYTRQWFEEAAQALQASAPPADGVGGG